jgi:hypothetical protein
MRGSDVDHGRALALGSFTSATKKTKQILVKCCKRQNKGRPILQKTLKLEDSVKCALRIKVKGTTGQPFSTDPKRSKDQNIFRNR